MRIAKIIGTVTLCQCHPSFVGASLKMATPLSMDQLAGRETPQAPELVVWDELGAGLGSQIALTEGGEAAQPFYPVLKPVDAYNAALLDHIEIDSP